MPGRIDLRPADVLIVPATLMPVIAVYGTLRLSILYAISAAAIAALLLYRKSFPLLPSIPVLISFGILIGWAGLSSFWAYDPNHSLERLVKLVWIVLGVPLLFTAAKTTCEARRRRLTILLAIGWSIAAAFLILEVVFDGGFLLQTIRGPWLHDVAALKALKRGGTILLILSWVVALGLLNLRYRFAAIVILLLPGFFLNLIDANAALVGWLTALLVGILVWLLPKTIALWGAFAVLFVLLATPFATSKIPTDLTRLTDRISSPGIHRMAMWKFTTDRIFERPLMGWGLENSRAIPGGREIVPIADWIRSNPSTLSQHPNLPKLLEDNPPEYLPLHPHNIILQIWLELGFVGVVLAGSAVAVVLLIVEKRSGPKHQYVMSLAMSSAWAAIACLSFGAWQTWWLSAVILAALLLVALLEPRASDLTRNSQ